jgi:predicted nucleic acid-binding protein
LSDLITSPGVEFGELTVHLDALGRYSSTKLHFVDCLIAAHAVAGDIPMATFDIDFKKFPDVRINHEV